MNAHVRPRVITPAHRTGDEKNGHGGLTPV
mgnify:CR=1 FL=1